MLWPLSISAHTSSKQYLLGQFSEAISSYLHRFSRRQTIHYPCTYKHICAKDRIIAALPCSWQMTWHDAFHHTDQLLPFPRACPAAQCYSSVDLKKNWATEIVIFTGSSYGLTALCGVPSHPRITRSVVRMCDCDLATALFLCFRVGDQAMYEGQWGLVEYEFADPAVP